MFSSQTIAKNPVMILIKHHSFSDRLMGSQTPIFEHAFKTCFERFNVPYFAMSFDMCRYNGKKKRLHPRDCDPTVNSCIHSREVGIGRS